MVGLWEPDFRAETPAADCAGWRLDVHGFCTADDARNGVELGVKFQTSRDLLITGIRVYRVDLATITGSLWDADGSRLATGRFAPTDAQDWQDLTFSRPVAISPGTTYVASYYSPATKYAFHVRLLQGRAADPRAGHRPACRRGRSQRRALLRRGERVAPFRRPASGLHLLGEPPVGEPGRGARPAAGRPRPCLRTSSRRASAQPRRAEVPRAWARARRSRPPSPSTSGRPC